MKGLEDEVGAPGARAGGGCEPVQRGGEGGARGAREVWAEGVDEGNDGLVESDELVVAEGGGEGVG